LGYYDIAIAYSPLFLKRLNLFLKDFTPVAILYMTKVIVLLFLFNPTLVPKIKRMKHYVETQWTGKMQFNALVNGHTLVMDGPEKVGGENNGPIPKPFQIFLYTTR